MQGILLEYAWLLVGNDKPNTPVGQCPITNNYESTGCGRWVKPGSTVPDIRLFLTAYRNTDKHVTKTVKFYVVVAR